MSRHDGSQIEIYIGDSVRYASERAVLEWLVHLLGAARQPAIILANVSIDGQQIDALVATGSLALVIKAKAFNRPVKGGENGPWQVRLASGQWKNFWNPYLVARSKNFRSVSCIAQLSRYVHALMQDPDDKDTLVINDIHHQMFFVLVNAHRRVKFLPFRRYLRGLCQSNEFFIQPAQITPPLDRAPLILRIVADFPDIVLRCVADTKPCHYIASSCR